MDKRGYRPDVPTSEIVYLYQRGMGTVMIAKRFSMTPSAVLKRLRRAQVAIRPVGTNQENKLQPTIEQRQRWYAHVKATPGGMVPVLFMGIPAWNVAMGPSAKVLEHFRAVAPVEHWPEWARDMENR